MKWPILAVGLLPFAWINGYDQASACPKPEVPINYSLWLWSIGEPVPEPGKVGQPWERAMRPRWIGGDRP